MHAFGVDDTLQLLALFSCCLDVDQFNRAQVVWFWEVLKPSCGQGPEVQQKLTSGPLDILLRANAPTQPTPTTDPS